MYAFYKVVNEVIFPYNDLDAAQADDVIRC